MVKPRGERHWRVLRTNGCWFDQYVEACLPGGHKVFGRGYYAKGWDPVLKRCLGWHAVKNPEGLWLPVDERAVLQSLTGMHRLAVEPPSEIVYIEFDLDRHDEGTSSIESCRERVERICRALGWAHLFPHALPGVLYRSSSGRRDTLRWPGGWRWRIYLDASYPREEVARVVRELLAVEGIDLHTSGGSIEAWPITRMSFPLCVGSDVIDINGRPLTASQRRKPGALADLFEEPEVGESWVRTDLEAAVALFAAAKAAPISFAELDARATSAANRRGSKSGQLSLNSEPAWLPPPAWDHSASAPGMWTPAPITADGQRNVVFRRWVFALWDRGYSWDEAEKMIMVWLDCSDHTHGKLALGHPQRESTITKMRRDARADFMQLGTKRQPSYRRPRSQRQQEQHRAVLAASRLVGHDGAFGAVSSHLSGQSIAEGNNYSPLLDHRLFATARNHVTDRDKQRLAAGAGHDPLLTEWMLVGGEVVKRPKTRGRPPLPRLDLVVGALRQLMGTEPGRIAIHFDTLARELGHEFPTSHPMHGKRAPVTYVIAMLQRLGFLGRMITRGTEGVTSSVYEVPADLEGPGRASLWPEWDELMVTGSTDPQLS